MKLEQLRECETSRRIFTRNLVTALAAVVLLAGSGCVTSPRRTGQPSPAGTKAEFIYDVAPFPSCHASTIAEGSAGVIAAWFGGTAEKNPDVGIWVARSTGGRWSKPVEVANGVQPGGQRYPTWNPVLFQPRDGALQLYYKVGPTPSTWWGMRMSSADGGRTWTAPVRLPDSIVGPIKNKPIQLNDGTIVSPSSTEHDGWRVHVERSADSGATWTTSGPLNDGREFGAIQPTFLRHGPQRLQMLCRSRQHVIVESWSEDGGATWTPLKATNLPNPNSGIDGVTLADGRHLLVYNPVPRGRSPLVLAISNDGRNWTTALVLEDQPGEFSYPAIIQSRDGRVHVTYTWRREKIRHWAIELEALPSMR